MNLALVCLAVIPAWLMAGALLVDRFRSEAAHRRERERLVRATLARHMPEFQALQRVIEGDAGAEARAAVRAVPEPDDWPKGAPRVPEGMTG